jgi:TonB family protein
MATTKVRRKCDGSERLEHHLQTASGKISFLVVTFENPEPKQSLEQFLTDERLKNGYDPASERRLTIDGFSGIEYSSPNKEYPTIVQFVATDVHVYSFMVNGARAADKAKEFFSSIKLGKRPGGLEVSEGFETPSTSEVGERIYRDTDVDVKVQLLSKPEPIYTEEARTNRTHGRVVLEAMLARTGRVAYVRVVKALPNGLTEAAINAAKKIKFTPAMKDGQPVTMWVQLEYNFKQ